MSFSLDRNIIGSSHTFSTEYPCSHPYLVSPSSALLFTFSGSGMAVLGNLALLLDVTSPRTIVLDRSKTRLLPSDIVLNLFKKDPVTPTSNLYASLSSKGGIEFEKDATTAPHRGVRGRKANSKFNEVDYESSSDEDNGNGYGDDEEVEDDRKKRLDWEKEMRMRVKEIEDMRELEKKAEELQSRGQEDEGESGDEGEGESEGTEETEEQKRMRVRRELEKVRFLLIPGPKIYAPGQ